MKKRAIALILAMCGIGANHAASLKPARWDTAEGWRDLTIPIDSVSNSGADLISVVARGILDGNEVGLRLLIKRDMPPGIRGNKLNTLNASAFISRGIIIESIGDPTERLVKSLADAYSTERPRAPLRPAIPWTTIALEGDPGKVQSEFIRFKIFHDENDERGLYYELFVHVDIPEGKIALNEKDEEYRPAVIRGFFDQDGPPHNQRMNQTIPQPKP